MSVSLKINTKITRSGSDVTPFGMVNPSIKLRASSLYDDIVEKIDVSEATQSFQFTADYLLWKQETSLLSVNNFDNKHFNAIVSRGEESVPYIYEQLKKGPTRLIYALELICPDRVNYDKDKVSLKRARKIWLKTLKEQLG